MFAKNGAGDRLLFNRKNLLCDPVYCFWINVTLNAKRHIGSSIKDTVAVIQQVSRDLLYAFYSSCNMTSDHISVVQERKQILIDLSGRRISSHQNLLGNDVTLFFNALFREIRGRDELQ